MIELACDDLDFCGSLMPRVEGWSGSLTACVAVVSQLSFDMGRETSLKLEWLKQISQVLRPEDPEIVTYVSHVLTQLR
jgi:hypothetical protein